MKCLGCLRVLHTVYVPKGYLVVEQCNGNQNISEVVERNEKKNKKQHDKYIMVQFYSTQLKKGSNKEDSNDC